MKIEYNGKYISYFLCQISDTIYLKYNITYFVIYNRKNNDEFYFVSLLFVGLIYRIMDSVLFVVVLITFEDITFAFNYRVSSCPLAYWFNIFRKSFCKNLVGKSCKAMQSNRHLLLLIAQSSGKCYQG